MEDGKEIRKILFKYWSELSALQIKTFITLYWLADPDSHTVNISIFRLSRKAGTTVKNLRSDLHELRRIGLIEYTMAPYPTIDSSFKILVSNVKADLLSDELTYLPWAAESAQNCRSKIDNEDDNDINSCNTINDNEQTTNFVNKASGRECLSAEDKEKCSKDNNFKFSAEHIAKRLNDEKNLALYKAYVKRYPRSVIEKAYRQVINFPAERIRKSRGALFTFLVKRLSLDK